MFLSLSLGAFTDDGLNQIVVHLHPAYLVAIVLLHLPIRLVVPHIEKIQDPGTSCEDNQSAETLERNTLCSHRPCDQCRQNGEPQRSPPDLDHDMVDCSEEENLLVEYRRDMIVQDEEIELSGI
jgi:hypothetical protein